MPRHFIAQLKYGNLTPWINSIEGDPPGEGEGGGAGGGSLDAAALQAQLKQLNQDIKNRDEVIGKLRGFERKYKLAAEAVGDLDPDRLKTLDEQANTYAARLAEMERQQEEIKLKARQEVLSEYDPKLQTLNKEKEQLQNQVSEVKMTFDLFQDFNANGGIGNRFEAFVQLAGGNFERNKEGNIQVRDDAGSLVIYKDPDAKAGESSERVATPADFLKMLGSGDIGKQYKFNQLEMLKLTLEAHNKSSGAGLPGQNGYNGTKPLADMSQSELASMIFQG